MSKYLGMSSERYKLDAATVDMTVEDKKIGNYALGYVKKGSFYVKYVGRSDNNFGSRIKDHTGEDKNYKCFKYTCVKTAKEAYERECQNYHDFSNLDNERHPDNLDNPDYKQYKCPVCGQ